MQGNIDEPTGYDLSDYWFAINTGGLYDDDLTAAEGDGYNVWRF